MAQPNGSNVVATRIPPVSFEGNEQIKQGVLEGVEAVTLQASKVGLEQSFADAPDYVSHNDAGTAALLAALCDSGFHGRLVLASSMVVYGEGSYECPRHGFLSPPPRRPEDLAVGSSQPSAPGARPTFFPGR